MTVEDLKLELDQFKALLLTSDLYIQHARLPQLKGGVVHSAGSEEVIALGDRWTYVNPGYGVTLGDGYNFIDPTTTGSATIVDETAEGRLISLGMLVAGSNSGSWSGGETVNASLRITIDGGTAVNLPLAAGGNEGWNDWLLPWATTINGTVGASPRWGAVDGDTFKLDFNLAYKTSLKIELVINSATGFAVGEDYLWFCYTHRAHLVTG